MNDKSESFDTWGVNETVNEDFDFGEGDTQAHPIKIKPVSKYNKKMIGFMFVIIIAFVVSLGLGYRIYSHKSLASKNAYNKTELTKASLPTETIDSTPFPKDIKETPAEIKKQSDEFGAAFSDIMPSAQAVPESALTQPKSTIASAPMPEDTPAPVLSTPTAEKNRLLEEVEAPKLHQELNALNNQIDSILNQIKYLDTYSREVSANLNKLNTSLNAMDNRLLTLIASTATLSQEVGAAKSEMGQMREILKENRLDTTPLFLPKTKQEQKGVPIIIAKPEYKVHAVIPGRAWLKSTKGQIVTVTEGDSIGHYGKILVIDAPNGVVLTSSGVVFRS